MSTNDVFQMIKVPIDAVIVGGNIVIDSSGIYTYTVGDGASNARYIPASSVSLSQTSKNFVSDLSSNIAGTGHKYTAADTIDVKFTAVGSAGSNTDFTLTVFYIVDGQTGGTVSS